MTSFHVLTHGVRSSRSLKRIATDPPGASTRWISDIASSNRNQWNACATVTRSTDASSSGMLSATPSSTVDAGQRGCQLRAHAGHRLDRDRRSAPASTSSRVNLPVPAARSQHAAAGTEIRTSPQRVDRFRRIRGTSTFVVDRGGAERGSGGIDPFVGHATQPSFQMVSSYGRPRGGAAARVHTITLRRK